MDEDVKYMHNKIFSDKKSCIWVAMMNLEGTMENGMLDTERQIPHDLTRMWNPQTGEGNGDESWVNRCTVITG